MSLRTKSLLFTLLIGLLVVVGVSVMMYRYLVLRYQEIEESSLLASLESAERGLGQQIDQMNVKLGDWAVWDDAYNYVQRQELEFERSNLVAESIELLQIDAIIFQTRDGKVLKKVGYDRNAGKLIDFPHQLDLMLATLGPMEARSGIDIDESNRLYIYSRRPILKSDGTGPIIGLLTFVKYYTEKELSALSEVVGIDLGIRAFEDGDNEGVFVKVDDTISSSVVIRGVGGGNVATLTGSRDRQLFRLGINSIVLVIVVVVSGVIVLSMSYYWQLHSLILKRIIGMEIGLKRIMNEGGFDKRLYKTAGDDEISDLEKMINELLDDLEEKDNMVVEEKNRIVSYFESAPVMIVVVNNKGGVEYANRGVILNFGDRDRLEKIIATIGGGDTKMLSLSGKELIVNWVVSVSSSGRIYVGVDVTEMRRFEEDKEERIRQLEIINQAMVEREAKMAELKEKIKTFEHT